MSACKETIMATMLLLSTGSLFHVGRLKSIRALLEIEAPKQSDGSRIRSDEIMPLVFKKACLPVL